MPRDFLTFPMKEDRVRQYVGRGRIFWLLIDGCLSIFHFRRQASKNFIHEHDRCTTLLNDATGSASVLMLQLPSERLTMWKVSIRQSCSWQWSNRARSTYENIDGPDFCFQLVTSRISVIWCFVRYSRCANFVWYLFDTISASTVSHDTRYCWIPQYL